MIGETIVAGDTTRIDAKNQLTVVILITGVLTVGVGTTVFTIAGKGCKVVIAIAMTDMMAEGILKLPRAKVMGEVAHQATVMEADVIVCRSELQ